MERGHGGNILKLSADSGMEPGRIIDFSSNINPLGFPDYTRRIINRNINRILSYPDPDSLELAEAVSEVYGINKEKITIGNGTTELITTVTRVLNPDTAIIPVPSYSDYQQACISAGTEVRLLLQKEENNFELDLDRLSHEIEISIEKKGKRGIVFLGRPNNPTGCMFDKKVFLKICRKHKNTIFCIDEAFLDFVDGCESLLVNHLSNIVVFRSLTKFFAIPGIRLGWCYAAEKITEKVKEALPGWSVNTFAQELGSVFIKDREFAARSLAYIRQAKKELTASLSRIPDIKVFPGTANFILIKLLRKNDTSSLLYKTFLKSGIAIRDSSNFAGLNNKFIRIAVKKREENTALINLMNEYFAAKKTPRIKTQSKKPAIMFQGTSSNSGKSILTAAFCRILIQDGYKAAPFKAQNMSLNSYVTDSGEEMGRAQALQARAARTPPDIRMNPVLLKPNSDTGSQIILMGKPKGRLAASNYTKLKASLWQTVKESYDSLSEGYDALVLEGAGSPAEVNLKKNDIVNMRMAEHASAPVLIVGDIDRGGIFASFIGTMNVFEEWENKLVSGFILNKFRGDESLLKSACDYIKEYTGRSILGVIPYIDDLLLPDEDSVSFKEQNPPNSVAGGDNKIHIAVIDLPYISNFTDFDPFTIEPDVVLHKISRMKDFDRIGEIDVIIIPGSKNVIADLKFMNEKGISACILKNSKNTKIVGICGGFQILGKTINDDSHIESGKSSVKGLGLLDIETSFHKEKTLTRTRARHIKKGIELEGYEIHHGITKTGNITPIIKTEKGETAAAANTDGSIWGTYLHGIFDSDDFRRAFINDLRISRGFGALEGGGGIYDIDKELDRLAEIVRERLPLDYIYKKMGLK